MFVKPSFSIPPQVGTVRSPRPRNSSPDWIAIAMPAMIGGLDDDRRADDREHVPADDAQSRSGPRRVRRRRTAPDLTAVTEAYTSR